MKELVVISGKGGTGKTSVLSCFAALAENPVLADCDVDASDLHLILNPEVIHSHDFSGGNRAEIMPEKCTACGTCHELCRFDAVQHRKTAHGKSIFAIDPIACEGCGVCAHFCPAQAVSFKPAVNGQWFISKTRFGPMVHARLGVAEENSGKLVSLVRQQAKKIAQDQGRELILVDGPPGVGCPVIASISGANLVLAVTEPTLSGLHDLERVIALARHFDIPLMVSVNKWDINPSITSRIEEQASRAGAVVAAPIRYDSTVTRAQIQMQSVVEYDDTPAAQDIRKLWKEVLILLLKNNV
jgi:MinD superfamily P-loop ATPase